MIQYAISAEGVSKRYRISQGVKPKYKTMRDIVASIFTSPFNKLGNGKYPQEQVNLNGSGGKHQYIWALRDVDFKVEPGEIVGLVGRNGAGKSTLLKILTRITDPTEGSIDIYGRVGSLLEVGTGFHKELTGRENVYLNGAILGMRKTEIDKKFDEIVSFSEVEKFIDTPVKFYSSGMQVRLAFAVAAHLEPEILLVDEVLAVGDASFQRKCLSKMEDVGKEGRTVIFVSHHMPSINRLCERAVLLEQGQIIMSGPAQEVVAQYLSTNLGATSSNAWENDGQAPGNDIVRLRSARIKDEQNQTNYTFDVRQPIGIEMEYEVLKSGYALYPYFMLHNDENIRLFTSIDTEPTWRGLPRSVGRYLSTGWIPGNLLAEGLSSITLAMRTEEPKIVHFSAPDVLAFQVVESPEGDSARVDYPGKFRGVVRPFLKWETNYVKMGESING